MTDPQKGLCAFSLLITVISVIFNIAETAFELDEGRLRTSRFFALLVTLIASGLAITVILTIGEL